jgi:hypothetical protein
MQYFIIQEEEKEETKQNIRDVLNLTARGGNELF